MKLIYNYGGYLKYGHTTEYARGSLRVIDNVDPDKIGYFDLLDWAKECGDYPPVSEIYYAQHGCDLGKGLRRIYGDKETIEMVAVGEGSGNIISLYLVHQTHLSSSASNEKSKEVSVVPDHYERTPEMIKTISTFTPSQLIVEEEEVKLTDVEISEEDPNEKEKEGEGHEKVAELEKKKKVEMSFGDKVLGSSSKSIDRDETEDVLGKEVLLGADSDTDDEECQDARRNFNEWHNKQNEKVHEIVNLILNTPNPTTKATCIEDRNHVSEYEESDDYVDTPGESEEDDIRGKKRKKSAPVVDSHTDFTKIVWQPGMRFPNRESFREGVRKYGIFQGRNLKFNVSNKKRNEMLGARCIEGCPFQIMGSWHSRKGWFIVRKVTNTHTCHRDMKNNTQLGSRWIAKEFLDVFKAKPHWPAKDIQDAVKEKLKYFITKCVAYRAKWWAHKMLHGSMKEHYQKLPIYMAALHLSNPNTILKLAVRKICKRQGIHRVQVGAPEFRRLFVCFEALKKGFLAGCRKVICFDGCFLKTFLGGMLLTAVGRDANDQMFPIAWAVVEGENNESWSWFMKEFKKCLDCESGEEWTFMSDQQKGLLNAVAEVFPKGEHRNCARHIYANWHKSYKGDELKVLFWRAARAYSEADYNSALDEMKILSEPAATAFHKANPQTFCRCFANTTTKCDVIVNNMAETFNGYIINARAKHVIDMLEDIRIALMQRLANKRAHAARSQYSICPRIQNKLEKEKDKVHHCQVMPSSLVLFQVRDRLDDVSVNLESRTCTCRKWDLTGIPCHHASACIYFLNNKPEDYVSDCYMKITYLKSYEYNIMPCVSEKHWPRNTGGLALDPPPIKIGPGRPRKNRARDPHEDPKKPGKLTRHGIEITCKVCNNKGHNKRTCPQKDNSCSTPTSSPIKRPKGRPRKSVPQSATLMDSAQADLHQRTAEPSARGRGRGSRGRHVGGRGSRKKNTTMHAGYGVFYNKGDGGMYINSPGQTQPVLISNIIPSSAQSSQEPHLV